jgi:hypothetical protein
MSEPKGFQRREEIDEETRARVLARVYLEILSWPDPADKKVTDQAAQEDVSGTTGESASPAEEVSTQDSSAQDLS